MQVEALADEIRALRAQLAAVREPSPDGLVAASTAEPAADAAPSVDA